MGSQEWNPLYLTGEEIKLPVIEFYMIQYYFTRELTSSTVIPQLDIASCLNPIGKL